MKLPKRILTVAICAAMTASVMSFRVSAEELPDKYDLRTEDVLGDVKNQGAVGSCWAFSGIGILESWLRANDMGDYSFSVRHMDAVTSLAYADSFNKETGAAYRSAYSGGFDFTALTYYFSGLGPVLESDYPYIPTYEGNYTGDRRGAECKTAGISVKDVGLGSCVGDLTIVSVSETNDIINEIKNSIADYGAVSASYYAAGDDSVNYYESSVNIPNHQIIIVGWDDNYSKNNFVNSAGLSPEKDGAWIIKNSWGTDSGENGYFYMSYETLSLYAEPYYYIERASETSYDQIYLSSPLAATKYITSSTDNADNTDYSLNLFGKTAGDQSVTEVTAALRGNSYYEIYVIANYETGGENFGKRVGSGYADRDCYKTIEFDPVKITGDTFGICIKYYSTDENLCLIPVQENYYSTGNYTGVDYTGSSFISHDGVTWHDTAKSDNSLVFVRAYTVNNNETHNVSLPSSYDYATAKLYKDGAEVYKNPDGSFDVESGTYQYEIGKMGCETLTGSITVKDKDVKLPYKDMKYCPSIEDINTELGLKDSGEFEILYLYGLDGENPRKVSSVEIGGKKVKFTQTTDGINVDRAQLSYLKAGDRAEIKVTYANGTSSSATVDVVKYTDKGAADILAEKVTAEVSKHKINSWDDIYDFNSYISEYVKKYSKYAVAQVSDSYFNEPTAEYEGGFGFTVTITYKGYTRTVNVSKSIDALGENALIPVMGSVSGWDNIAASEALKDAEENGGELSITLGSDGIIPETFVKEIAGTDAVIDFAAYDGRYSWKINCSDIKNIHDIDTNIYDGIALDLSNDSILWDYSTVTVVNLPFYIDSSFDITADLTINIRKLLPQLTDSYLFKDELFKYDSKGVLDTDKENDTIISYHSGKTEIDSMTSGSYVLMITMDSYLYGDTSMDMEGPDETDVKMLKLYISLGQAEMIKDVNPFAYAMLDINEDGTVDSDDVEALEKYVAALEKEKE